MTFAELQALIGSLTNDPNHDRYSLSDINLELDNTQDAWNLEAKIIKAATTLTTVTDTRQYSIFANLVGTPLSFVRVTHKGIDLQKRSKTYFDHLTGADWTQDKGTPTQYFIEMADTGSVNNTIYLTIYPTPQDSDAGANLVVSYIIRHTPMDDAADYPFTSDSGQIYLLRPYDFGVAYDTAARLLLRDPSPEAMVKVERYRSIGAAVLSQVVQVFKALEADSPKRLSGGRYWNIGNSRFVR